MNKCVICGVEIPEGRQVCPNCDCGISPIAVYREALKLSLSDKTYCRNCDLINKCGTKECLKFRTDEVLGEAKSNLEKIIKGKTNG